MGCGCNKAKAVQPLAQQQIQQNAQNLSISPSLEGQNNVVKVVYKGPNYSHMISSPTGIIRELYGMQNYGLGKNGDIIYVHQKDVEHSPWLYEVVQEAANEKAIETLAMSSPESEKSVETMVEELTASSVSSDKPVGTVKPKIGKVKLN